MDAGYGLSVPPIGALLASRYRVVRVIGAGGIGAVLEAMDERDGGRRVAVKVLQSHLLIDDVQRIRFTQELAVLRRLSHPNIVRVLGDEDAVSDIPIIAMEFVDGCSLRLHMAESAPLSLGAVCEILRATLSGLSYAHLQGVIHRDLKPDNILLTSAGQPKIADFGLARSLDTSLSLTPSGETVGTPLYMSPEQFRGARVDERADLYSLGIIAFEMLTGTRPFQDDNYVRVAAMHITTPLPRIEAVAKHVPAWLVDFVYTCCEKKPKHRFPNADSAAHELERGMRRSGLLTSDGIQRGGLSRALRSAADLFRR